LEKEKINHEDMIELLGERPWKELRTFKELSYGMRGRRDEEGETRKERQGDERGGDKEGSKQRGGQ
jgi:hypothetical protein